MCCPFTKVEDMYAKLHYSKHSTKQRLTLILSYKLANSNGEIFSFCLSKSMTFLTCSTKVFKRQWSKSLLWISRDFNLLLWSGRANHKTSLKFIWFFWKKPTRYDQFMKIICILFWYWLSPITKIFLATIFNSQCNLDLHYVLIVQLYS